VNEDTSPPTGPPPIDVEELADQIRKRGRDLTAMSTGGAECGDLDVDDERDIVVDALTAIRTGLLAVDDVLRAWAPDAERLDDMLLLRIRLDDLVREVQTLRDSSVEAAWPHLPYGRGVFYETPGIPYRFKRGFTQTRVQWNDERAIRDVYKACTRMAEAGDAPAVVDPETGEKLAHPETVMRTIEECAGFGYWRKGGEDTGLGRLGLDTEDYKTSEPGRKKIDLLPGTTLEAPRG
jgi:hypothetical protein